MTLGLALDPPHLALFAALALMLACPGGDGGTATTDTATTATTTTTGTATTDPATATGDTTATTSGASASATTATASTSSTSGPTPTTGATAPSTTTGDTGTTGPSTTTGGGGACEDLDGLDFGDCKAIIGTGLIGGKCVAISGCDCEPHCDAFFAGPLECASSCAAAGVCNEGLIEGRGLLMGPCTKDTQFDDTHICGGDPAIIAQLVPAECQQQGGYPCEEASMCTLPWGPFTDEEWASICAVSLLPDVELVACTLYGP